VQNSIDRQNTTHTRIALFWEQFYQSVNCCLSSEQGKAERIVRCRFKAFHERYYHPSNARFWFYGDDDPAERLRLLAAYLDEFDAQPVDSAVTAQPLFQVRSCNEPLFIGQFYSFILTVCSAVSFFVC